MKFPAALVAVTAALVTVLAIAPVAPAAPPSATSSLTTTLTGTATNAAGTVVGTASSVLNLTGFAVQNGQLVGIGTLTTTITDAITGLTQTITQAVTLPVTASGSCQVLHLDVGPIDLNVLGLQVHLNEVVLDISATSGPGQLVGNLVCAVTHLLDNPAGVLNGVAALLNVIIGAL